MIEVKGKTLFEWSMESLVSINKETNASYYFVVRKEDEARDFIEEKASVYGIKKVCVIEIDELTDGQATSAMKAKPFWQEDEELIIYNIDTYIESGVLRYSDIVGDGFIPCFNAPGTHWSFVKLDDDGKVVEVCEKKRISDNCTIGLYYFRTCGLFNELYEEYYADDSHLEMNEKYIAPLYNYMVKKGLEVRIEIIPFEKVHVLGTPEEVELFREEK